MPNVTLPIDEGYQSILRPVVTDIVKSIMEFTGLPTTIQVRYPGMTGALANTGTTINDSETKIEFQGNDQMFVEVNAVPKEERMLSTPTYHNENPNVFYDPALGVYMQPVFTVTDVTLSLRINLQSRSQALRWLREMKYKVSMGRVESMHVVNYSYPIPVEFLVILKHLSDLKESKAGYNETLKDWLNKCMTPRRVVTTDLSGQNKTLVIGERQAGVLGAFDFTASPPPPEKNGETGGWTVGFDYTFTYDEVTGVNFKYPLVVHNQLIDGRFFDETKAYSLQSHNRYASLSRNLFGDFAALNLAPHELMDGVQIPAFDEWAPPRMRNGTSSLLRVLYSFDDTVNKDLFQLTSIPDYQFTTPTINYMLSELDRMTSFGNSMIYITAHADQKQLPDGSLTVRPDGSLVFVGDIDLRKTYHIRVALVWDLSLLTTEAKDRLKLQKDFLIETIKSIYGDKASQVIKTIDDAIKITSPSGRITDKTLDDVIGKLISNNDLKYDSGTECRLLTVGSYLVTAHKD